MKRIHVLWGIAALLVVGLIGCLEIPLGDPETSKTDDALVGLWLNSSTPDEQSEMLAVMNYDGRTYLISQMKFVKTDAGYQSRGQMNIKAWLTKIGDTTFITAEPKDPKSLVETPDKAYVVAKLTRTDNHVTLQSVDNQFVKDAGATTPAALAKLIADNLGNPKLYEGETGTYTKLGADEAEKAKAILGAFTEPKQQNASTGTDATGTGL